MKAEEREEYAVEVGNRLKNAREAVGISQIEFARRLGHTTAATVSNWENGWNMIPPQYAVRIFRILRIDSNYLYLDDPSSLPHTLYDKLFPQRNKSKKS